MTPSSPNTSNHQRIARLLHRATGCGYQKALQRVQDAASAGRLPARLDQAGREEAVRILTETHPQPVPATAVAEGAPPLDMQSSAALVGLVRGGLEKTVAVADVGVWARGRRVLPVDLGDLAPTELLLTVHRAMERRRNLQRKEQVVAAMRAERDRNLAPYLLLPAIPGAVREEMERLVARIRPKPRSGEPQ